MKLKLAYKAMKDQKFDSALIRFVELADIGILSAQANAIYLIDRKLYSSNIFDGKLLNELRSKYLAYSSLAGYNLMKHQLADEVLIGQSNYSSDLKKIVSFSK